MSSNFHYDLPRYNKKLVFFFFALNNIKTNTHYVNYKYIENVAFNRK